LQAMSQLNVTCTAPTLCAASRAPASQPPAMTEVISSGVSSPSPLTRVALITRGCQIGYEEHTGCHRIKPCLDCAKKQRGK
jgi:hypothetical protein